MPPSAGMGRAAWAVLAGLLLYLSSQVSLLAAFPLWFWDPEALHNATVARECLVGHADQLLQLQYMDFCGGCTAVSLAGWGIFELVGFGFAAWKAVPLLVGVGILWTGAALLARRAGPAAAVAFALLLALAPTLVAQMQLMAWGNHYEVMLLVVLQGWIVTRVLERAGHGWWFAWGLSAGLGIWFCLSSAFALPCLALLVAASLPWRRWLPRVPSAAAGLALGLAPMLVYRQVVGGSATRVFENAEWLQGPLLAKSWEALLGAHAQVLLTTPSGAAGGGWLVLVGLWGAVLAALVLDRRRAAVPLALLAGALGQYVLGPLRADVNLGGGVAPIVIRYLNPVMLAWVLAAGAGLGLAWRRRGAWRLLALGLAALVLVPGLLARARWVRDGLSVDPPALSQVQAHSYGNFNGNGLRNIDAQTLLADQGSDLVSRVNRQRAYALRLAPDFLEASPEDALALLQHLRSLPAPSSWYLGGLAVELNALQRYGHVTTQDYLPQLSVLLQAGSDEEVAALAAPLWLGNPGLADHPSIQLAGCVLCPAEGVALARPAEHPDKVPDLGTLVEGGEQALATDPQRRAAQLRGIGALWGDTQGWRIESAQRLAGRLPEADAEPFLEGFALGRATRWVSQPEADTPAERVPPTWP